MKTPIVIQSINTGTLCYFAVDVVKMLKLAYPQCSIGWYEKPFLMNQSIHLMNTYGDGSITAHNVAFLDRRNSGNERALNVMIVGPTQGADYYTFNVDETYFNTVRSIIDRMGELKKTLDDHKSVVNGGRGS